MKTLVISFCAMMTLTSLSWAATEQGSATGKAGKTAAAAKIVTDVLQRETKEPMPNRAEKLKPALELAQNYEPALWSSGFIYDAVKKEWLRYDEAPAAAKDNDRLAAYRSMRSKSNGTTSGQMELAQWCLKHNLNDQARAHLTKILETNGDNVEARRLLGERFLAGQWISEGDIANAEAQAKKDSAAFRKWRPKIEKIQTNLQRGKRQSDAANSELMAITDPEAAGAIALVLCADGGDAAPLGIDALKNLPGRESAMALTQLAFYLPWDPLGKSAAVALNTQNKHDFVPMLISQLQTPLQSKAEIYESFNNGTLLYRHVFYREGQDARDLAVFDTPYRQVFSKSPQEIVPASVGRLGARERAAYEQEARRKNLESRMIAMANFQADAMQKAARNEQAVMQFNIKAEALNVLLCSMLSEANRQYFSKKDLSNANNETWNNQNQPQSPSDWYQWWNDYNEVYTPEIPTRTIYVPGPGKTLITTPYAVLRLSCLVGDTNVWTESGPLPIKDVAIGDRVFACDVETGCLALKPVLKVTIRPKENTGDLVSITADGKKILASGGHVFWVVGKGWMKARDLKAGMRLHTMKGTADIEEVGTGKPQTTYNLIVADFHTFYAGDVISLTHDNTVRQPTNMIVPGLSKQAVAADR